MATAQGFRYSLVRLPTPGSGLDDQDRYAIGGCPLPANSITPPTIGGDFGSKQRAAIAGMIVPDNALNDQQDRYHLAGVIQPTLANVNISAQQRAFIAGLPGWGGGAGFSKNDRAHIAGIYPYVESSSFTEVFDLFYALRPTSTAFLTPVSNSGVLDGVISSIVSGWSARAPRLRGGLSRHRHRHVIKWDGEIYVFDSKEDADEFLAEKKEIARKKALDMIVSRRAKRGIVTKVNFDILERSKK